MLTFGTVICLVVAAAFEVVVRLAVVLGGFLAVVGASVVGAAVVVAVVSVAAAVVGIAVVSAVVAV